MPCLSRSSLVLLGLALCCIAEASASAEHGALSNLPTSCQTRLDTIYNEQYSADALPSNATASCSGSCRSQCKQTIQQAFAGQDSNTCPSEADIRACMKLAEDEWVELAMDCTIFSSPFAPYLSRRRLQDSGAAPASAPRIYSGAGCFPAFEDAMDLKSWLQGTYSANAASAVLQASTGVVHGEVAVLPPSCQSSLNGIYDEYYSATTTKPADYGSFNCVGACRTICRDTIQKALDGRDTVDCPAEYDIQACMNLAQDDWLALAESCALFSAPFTVGSAASPAALGGRRRMFQAGEGVAGPATDSRGYSGAGCFPVLANTQEFKSWLVGTYSGSSGTAVAPSPAASTSPTPSSTVGTSGAEHGEVAVLPKSCQATLNTIYDGYYAKNSSNKADWGSFQCVGNCRTACKSTIEAALTGRDSTKCPSELDIQNCMNLAQDDWLALAKDCALFSSPYHAASGTTASAGEAEGRRRHLLAEAAEGVVSANARSYSGDGCFPQLLSNEEFKSWLEGTYKPVGQGSLHPVAVIMPILYAIGIGSMAFF